MWVEVVFFDKVGDGCLRLGGVGTTSNRVQSLASMNIGIPETVPYFRRAKIRIQSESGPASDPNLYKLTTSPNLTKTRPPYTA